MWIAILPLQKSHSVFKAIVWMKGLTSSFASRFTNRVSLPSGSLILFSTASQNTDQQNISSQVTLFIKWWTFCHLLIISQKIESKHFYSQPKENNFSQVLIITPEAEGAYSLPPVKSFWKSISFPAEGRKGTMIIYTMKAKASLLQDAIKFLKCESDDNKKSMILFINVPIYKILYIYNFQNSMMAVTNPD